MMGLAQASIGSPGCHLSLLLQEICRIAAPASPETEHHARGLQNFYHCGDPI